MVAVVWSRIALADLRRLHAFLADNDPRAADAAILTIQTKTRQLQNFPLTGHTHASIPDRRELVVHFANSGYSVLYAVDEDAVRILAIRHMREASY